MHVSRSDTEMFVMDLGRWKTIASITKELHLATGYEGWKVVGVDSLGGSDRKVVVEAYLESPTIEETVNVTLADEVAEEDKDAIIENLKNQVRALKVANTKWKKKAKQAQKPVKEEPKGEPKAEPAQKPAPVAKRKFIKPTFMKEPKQEKTEFTLLRDCVLFAVSDYTYFDAGHLANAAISCGAKERGINPKKFAGPAIIQLLRGGLVKQIGVGSKGEKQYKVTAKGLDYLKQESQYANEDN